MSNNELDARSTAEAVAKPIGGIGTAFMLHPSVYEHGTRLGYSGLDFYFHGRGGVLGDVDADVVQATFAFFEPDLLRAQWDQGASIGPAADAAAAFLQAGADWAETHFDDAVDADRLAALARAAAMSAPVTGLPLFAGWRALTAAAEPATAKGRALAWLNVLREHRGSLHVAAAAAVGLDPHAAVILGSGPGVAEFFGFPAPHPDPEDHRATWDRAEALTADGAAAPYRALTGTERAEFVALVRAAARA